MPDDPAAAERCAACNVTPADPCLLRERGRCALARRERERQARWPAAETPWLAINAAYAAGDYTTPVARPLDAAAPPTRAGGVGPVRYTPPGSSAGPPAGPPPAEDRPAGTTTLTVLLRTALGPGS